MYRILIRTRHTSKDRRCSTHGGATASYYRTSTGVNPCLSCGRKLQNSRDWQAPIPTKKLGKHASITRFAKSWRKTWGLPGFIGKPKDGGKANTKAARRGGRSRFSQNV